MNVNSQASSAIYFDDLEINVMGINEAFQPGQVINSPIPYSYLRMFDFNNSTDGSIEGLGKANMSGVAGFTNSAEADVYKRQAGGRCL